MMYTYPVAGHVIVGIILAVLFQHATGQGANTRSAASKVVSMTSELEAFYKIGELPSYREGTVVGQISSYDRTGGNDDGFSGRYSFVRRLPDSSLVLFDAAGPGVIHRIWTPTPSDVTDPFQRAPGFKSSICN